MSELESSSTGKVRVNSAVSVLLLAVCIVLALALAWMGRVILLLLFAAIVLASLLSAIIDWVMSKLKLGRNKAFALIALVGVALVVLALWLSGQNIVDQFASLQADLPQAVQKLLVHAREYRGGRWVLSQWSDYSQLSSSISYAVTQVGGIVLSTASLLTGLAIVAFLGVYLAAEPEVYFSGLRRMVPQCNRPTLDACALRAIHMIRS
jgi:predicted PurR-regulated permease PerM